MLAVVQHPLPAQRRAVRRLLPVLVLIVLAAVVGRSSLPPDTGPRGGWIALVATHWFIRRGQTDDIHELAALV